MSTNITIYAPRPADKALRVLAALLGMDNVTFILNPMACKLEAVTLHPLTETEATTTIDGWTSCVKYLAQNTILWESNKTVAEEDWIQAAATAMLHDTSIPDFVLTEQDLAVKIEQHFKDHSDQTYLVGDYPTASDLCVAIWLFQNKNSAGLIHAQTKAWMEMILANPKVQAIVNSDVYYD